MAVHDPNAPPPENLPPPVPPEDADKDELEEELKTLFSAIAARDERIAALERECASLREEHGALRSSYDGRFPPEPAPGDDEHPGERHWYWRKPG